MIRSGHIILILPDNSAAINILLILQVGIVEGIHAAGAAFLRPNLTVVADFSRVAFRTDYLAVIYARNTADIICADNRTAVAIMRAGQRTLPTLTVTVHARNAADIVCAESENIAVIRSVANRPQVLPGHAAEILRSFSLILDIQRNIADSIADFTIVQACNAAHVALPMNCTLIGDIAAVFRIGVNISIIYARNAADVCVANDSRAAMVCNILQR